MSLNNNQMKWPMETMDDLNRFFGDPRGRNGRESSLWYNQHTDFWVPPYPIFYSDGARTPLKRLRVHKKCIPIFHAAFSEVRNTLGLDYIEKHHLNISGGTFCYRLERGGSRLSVHSWAIAIDMDPQRNPFPKKWSAGKGMIDQKFVGILEKHGFYWRGREGDIDPMHFQLARHGRAGRTSARPVVRLGDVGSIVKELQQALVRKGAVLTVDGQFGPATDAAVKNVQRQNGLSVDGIVGARTWAALA